MGMIVRAPITCLELGSDDETTSPVAECSPAAQTRKPHFCFNLTHKETFLIKKKQNM